MRRFLIALALVVASVPASAHMRGYQFAPQYRPDAPRVPAPVASDFAGIRTVAIVSGVGSRFELESRGPTGRRSGAFDISAWQVDDRVEACVRLALKDRFRFVRIPYDRRALGEARAGGATAGRFAAFLKTLPETGIDAFVVIRPNAIGGLALQTIVHRDTILWTDFEIDVIDARSLTVIASASARIQPPGAPKANFPGVVVGHDYTLDPTLQLDPRQADNLRHLTNEMLTATLTETLAAMGMGR